MRSSTLNNFEDIGLLEEIELLDPLPVLFVMQPVEKDGASDDVQGMQTGGEGATEADDAQGMQVEKGGAMEADDGLNPVAFVPVVQPVGECYQGHVWSDAAESVGDVEAVVRPSGLGASRLEIHALARVHHQLATTPCLAMERGAGTRGVAVGPVICGGQDQDGARKNDESQERRDTEHQCVVDQGPENAHDGDEDEEETVVWDTEEPPVARSNFWTLDVLKPSFRHEGHPRRLKSKARYQVVRCSVCPFLLTHSCHTYPYVQLYDKANIWEACGVNMSDSETDLCENGRVS